MFKPAMLTQIGSVLKQALITFKCNGSSNKKGTTKFYENLELLKRILEKTKAEDVNLPSQLFMSEELWKRPSKAPVTYIDIYENDILSLGVFVLKPGMKLPLHDHPQMYGLIKVIAGKIKITSFSLNTEIAIEAAHSKLINLNNTLNDKRYVVEKGDELVLDATSSSSESCCFLEPYKRNLHEIESVDGPAAFLDILSPPYETIIENNGKRKCTYYNVIREISRNVYLLEETNSPSWFWSDSFPYDGPDLI